MIAISEYDSLYSLYIYALMMLPAIILSFLGKKLKLLDIVISIAIIISILGLHAIQLYEFFIFMIFELVLVYTYYAFRKRSSSELIYFMLFSLSMMPIIIVRLGAHTHYSSYLGFVGMSYICFKIWQLLIDIHDEKIHKLPLVDVFLFLTFAPSFSSGPISRYEGFCSECNKELKGSDYFNNYFITGIKKLVVGVLYKFAIAYFINTYIMANISTKVTFLGSIEYMYAYTVYLFFDFAGYSLIAIGTGYLMGISLPENFNKPFLARNMKEFWARWHMSLSTWFNDYVFSRFVLNNMRNGLFKNPKYAARVSYMFTMTTMGLWHGFNIHYLLYGIYEGLTLVLTDVYIKTKFYRKHKKLRYYDIVSRIICFQIIAFGMLLFSGYLIEY